MAKTRARLILALRLSEDGTYLSARRGFCSPLGVRSLRTWAR